jgi:hypothetical protein
MTANKVRESLDLSTYLPQDWDDIRPIHFPYPERTFEEGKEANWLTSVTASGVIVVNVVVREYLDDRMQIQLVPRTGSMPTFDTYYLNDIKAKFSIPDEVGERIFTDIFPDVIKALGGPPVAIVSIL